MCSDDFRVMQPILGRESSTISHRSYKIDELIRSGMLYLGCHSSSERLSGRWHKLWQINVQLLSEVEFGLEGDFGGAQVGEQVLTHPR